MDYKYIIIVSALAILIVGGAFYLYNNMVNNAPIRGNVPLSVGGIVVARVPKDAKVVYTNEGYAQRLQQLYNTGSLFTFQACARGSVIGEESNYDNAFKKALGQIGSFLKTTVRSMSELVKVNNSEFFKSVAQVLTNSKVEGSFIIAKYKYFEKDILLHNFCVVAIYDPYAAMQVKAVQASLKKIAKDYGISWEEFESKLEKAFKNAYGK